MTTKTNLISVCIPAYNVERWLAEAVESVQSQQWPPAAGQKGAPPIETIIVDDGSTDGTLAVARRLAGAAVKVVTQENRGAAAARNRALDEAQGDYIQFLDADDVLNPYKLGGAVHTLERIGDADSVAISRWGRFRDDPKTAETHYEPTYYRDTRGVDFLVSSVTQFPGGTQPIGSWLMPRSVVERAGRWDEATRYSPAEDGDYLLQVLSLGVTLRYDDDGFLFYRAVGASSNSNQRSERAIRSLFDGIDHFASVMLRLEESDRTRYAAACAYKWFLFDWYANGAPADLLRLAEERMRSYGGAPDFVPNFHWTPKMKALGRLIGWRAALRLRNGYRRFRY